MSVNEASRDILEFLTSVRSITANYKIISIAVRMMWRLLELLCYILAALIVLFAFVGIETGVIVFQDENIKITISNDEYVAIVYAIRMLLVLIALFMLLPAFLIRLIRKKNKQIESVHTLTVNQLAKIKTNG